MSCSTIRIPATPTGKHTSGWWPTPDRDPSSWRLKPTFHAKRRLLHLASDPGPLFDPAPLQMTMTGGTGDVRSVLLAKRDDTHLLALWRDIDVYDPVANQPLPVDPVDVTIQLATPADVALYQPSTQDEPIREWDATPEFTARLAGQVLIHAIAQ